MSASCFQVIAMTYPGTYEKQLPGGLRVVIEQKDFNDHPIKLLDDQELIRIAKLQFKVGVDDWF